MLPSWPNATRTTAFRLALIFSVLFALGVVLILAIVYWSTIGFLERQTSSTIEVEIQGLAEQFERQGLSGLVSVVAQRVERDPRHRGVYLFADRNFRPLAGNLDRWPTDVRGDGGWVNFHYDLNDTSVPVRARILTVRPGLTLLVGRDIRELVQIRNVFKEAAMLGLLSTMFIALGGGVIVGLAAQRRIAEINRMTRGIVAGDFVERLIVPPDRDEYAVLIQNLNGMFDQIESLVMGMRSAGDSIAHDLRTPLTRLRNHLDRLARQPTVEGNQLNDCLADADSLLSTFAAILRISRLESGMYRREFRQINVATIAKDVCELYQALAEENGVAISLNTREPAIAVGDQQLLAQALSNVLDNAIKYGKSGGSVEVGVASADGEVRVSVKDRGPGMASEDRVRVSERFTRLDEARNIQGNGLGLALTKAVAEQHGGTLLFEDNDPGAAVTLVFPTGQRSV
ncbi:MAG: HAMP domain-containing sensor histidine kinase [Pseudomonadales bacterium]